ncbi:hypothetical protein V6N13_099878 [Hibiscus sabdariffa]
MRTFLPVSKFLTSFRSPIFSLLSHDPTVFFGCYCDDLCYSDPGECFRRFELRQIWFTNVFNGLTVQTEHPCINGDEEISKLFNFHRQTAADIVNGIEIIFESPGAGLR